MIKAPIRLQDLRRRIYVNWLVRHSQRKRRETARPNLRSMAPVLDPTNRPPGQEKQASYLKSRSSSTTIPIRPATVLRTRWCTTAERRARAQ